MNQYVGTVDFYFSITVVVLFLFGSYSKSPLWSMLYTLSYGMIFLHLLYLKVLVTTCLWPFLVWMLCDSQASLGEISLKILEIASLHVPMGYLRWAGCVIHCFQCFHSWISSCFHTQFTVAKDRHKKLSKRSISICFCQMFLACKHHLNWRRLSIAKQKHKRTVSGAFVRQFRHCEGIIAPRKSHHKWLQGWFLLLTMFLHKSSYRIIKL